MVTIKVNPIGHGEPLEFQVVLLEGKSQTQYVVTMARRTWEDLTPGSTAEACIEAGVSLFARSRVAGINLETFRCRSDPTLLSRL
jgi:hypothetical protein